MAPRSRALVMCAESMRRQIPPAVDGRGVNHRPAAHGDEGFEFLACEFDSIHRGVVFVLSGGGRRFAEDMLVMLTVPELVGDDGSKHGHDVRLGQIDVIGIVCVCWLE